MKLGIITGIFAEKSLQETCKTVKEFGLEAIELGVGGFQGKVHCNPLELLNDRHEIAKFKKIIKESGLEISALACHGNPIHPQKYFAETHTRDLIKAIELAPKIDVKIITCFAGCPGAGEGARYPNWITCPWPPYFGESIQWQWEKIIIPFWVKMVKKAKKVGVKFGFEMHPGDAIYNTETLLKLREKVGEEEIACNFDPSHLFWQGMDPIVCINKLGSAIIHVHAKDCKINKKNVNYIGVNDWKNYKDTLNRAWTFRTVGYGHGLDFWKDFIFTLKKNDFNGFLSIEHEDLLMPVTDALVETINLLKQLL